MSDNTISEKDLALQDSFSATDFLRAVSGNNSTRVSSEDLAKYIIEAYDGSILNETEQSIQDAITEIASSIIAGNVSGVKGNNEINYRTGNVNLTAENIGASPVLHAVSSDTYGKGTDSNYGHIKLSDAINDTTAAEDGGTAATPKAVKTVHDLIGNKQDTLVSGTNIKTINNTSILGTGNITTPTYSDFVGTNGVVDGQSGLVPAPETTDIGKYLKSDGTWDTPAGGGGGGGSYSAISPINITNDVINHEASGVTTGIYTANATSDASGYYIPSFTIDAYGHITDASSLGAIIPNVLDSPLSNGSGLISQSVWASAVRSISYSNYTLAAGQTTNSWYIYDANSPYSTGVGIVGVSCFDATTYELVEVDWTVDTLSSSSGKQNYVILTVSIAEPYEHNIQIFPTVTYRIIGM